MTSKTYESIGALIATWINTMMRRNLLEVAHTDVIGMCVVAVFLLLLFFAVSGLEIAYTDLRDKDPRQLASALQPLITEMQSHEDVVYEAREWLGVVLIVVLLFRPGGLLGSAKVEKV